MPIYQYANISIYQHLFTKDNIFETFTMKYCFYAKRFNKTKKSMLVKKITFALHWSVISVMSTIPGGIRSSGDRRFRVNVSWQCLHFLQALGDLKLHVLHT